ncbi:MAG TPA: phosphoribosyltransferase family protein [Dehalococcoidia bacterium]|nr:phosphoribosyltransferase family protein [Dehalococcoidia bacterium]
MPPADFGNLWLAKALWDLGAVEFGDFNTGRTRHSPIYLNPRLLIGNPTAFRRSARVIKEEAETLLSMLHPALAPFSLVAGVPFGGLHFATAFSLITKIPLIYLHPSRSGEDDEVIEGKYVPGQTVLVIDDLITHGSSIVETALQLRNAGLYVHDAIVILDRKQGGRERLRAHGINLIAMLELETLLNYLMAHRKIEEEAYRRCLAYLEADRKDQ